MAGEYFDRCCFRRPPHILHMSVGMKEWKAILQAAAPDLGWWSPSVPHLHSDDVPTSSSYQALSVVFCNARLGTREMHDGEKVKSRAFALVACNPFSLLNLALVGASTHHSCSGTNRLTEWLPHLLRD